MQEKGIIDEDGSIITVRVVMSEDYQMPQEGFIRKQIAKMRLSQMIPDYDNLTQFERRKRRHQRGITICRICQYPQPIENTICCFCEEKLKHRQ